MKVVKNNIKVGEKKGKWNKTKNQVKKWKQKFTQEKKERKHLNTVDKIQIRIRFQL